MQRSLFTTRAWECSWGSPAREVRWSNTAAANPAVEIGVAPSVPIRDIAACRTFLTEPEAAGLRAQGVGRHLSAADLLVFGRRGPIGNAVRFADEPARHKILDLIGDLALCGFDLAGHVVAYRSGHALNVELARLLAARAAGSESLKVASRKVGTSVRRAA